MEADSPVSASKDTTFYSLGFFRQAGTHICSCTNQVVTVNVYPHFQALTASRPPVFDCFTHTTRPMGKDLGDRGYVQQHQVTESRHKGDGT